MAAMDHVRAAGGIRLTANSQINRVSLPVLDMQVRRWQALVGKKAAAR